MRKLNFWVPIQEPKWHTPVCPSIHLPPPPPRDDEEYQLFGTPSSSSSSSEEEDEVQMDELSIGEKRSQMENDDDDDDDEMDDDVGMLFSPLINSQGLNFFLNNELNNSSVMIDYFNDECFKESELQNECLLIVLYIYYCRLTQYKNFMRTMKSNKWLGKVVEKKLLKIKREVEDEFGKSEHGRGHWNEIEFMMKRFPIYFPSKFKNVTSSKRPMIRLTHLNFNLNLEMFPVYV